MVTGLTVAAPVPASAPPRAADGFAENTGAAEGHDFLTLLGVTPPTPEIDTAPTATSSDTPGGNALPLAATGGNLLPLLTTAPVASTTTVSAAPIDAFDAASRQRVMPSAVLGAAPFASAPDASAKPPPVAISAAPLHRPTSPSPEPAIDMPMSATTPEAQSIAPIERVAPQFAASPPLAAALATLDTAASALEPLTDRSALGVAHATTNASPASTSLTTAANAPPLPLLRPDWEPALAQRVRLMLDHGVQRADVSVNPPELGPIEVRIDLQQDRSAHVSFAAAHAGGREALEAGAARLRELLGDAGITAVHIDVSARSFAGRDNGGEPPHLRSHSNVPETDGATRGEIALRVGLLDLYA